MNAAVALNAAAALSGCGKDVKLLGFERLPVSAGGDAGGGETESNERTDTSGEVETSGQTGPNGEEADAGGDTRYPNYFREVLGYSEAAVSERIDDAFEQLFYGDAADEAIYYELEGEDEAYIYDVFHDDTRMDALGYGMMVTVQLDRQKEFDNIWSYALTHLRYDSGPAEGYFHPTCPLTGECGGGISRLGHFYAVTALFFAQGRWGSTGRFDYAEQAREQLRVMREKEAENGGVVDGVTNLFDAETALPTRPSDNGELELSTSSLMPAFFAVWAERTGDPFWDEAVVSGRELLIEAAHPQTGLIGEATTLQGTYPEGDEAIFRDNSYIVFLALALDYSWNGANPQLERIANRVIRFFSQFGSTYVAEYTLAGAQSNLHGSGALVAMNGALAAIASASERRAFIQSVWDAEMQRGTIRFFDGINQLMSLLYLGGRFRPY